MIILVLLFAFQRVLSAPIFAVVLYVVLMVLAALNLAPIRTPKLGGGWYYVTHRLRARHERAVRVAAVALRRVGRWAASREPGAQSPPFLPPAWQRMQSEIWDSDRPSCWACTRPGSCAWHPKHV